VYTAKHIHQRLITYAVDSDLESTWTGPPWRANRTW